MIVDKSVFSNQIIENLQSCILPFWMDNMVDPRGGFYGRCDGKNNIVADAPKGAILNARILWAFSAAYRLLRNPKYLEMANRAKREIIDRFYDAAHGGIFWSLNADGTPLDTKKQFYAIGFAIYGLSELVRATGDKEALDYAQRLFNDIEIHSRDYKRGGYREATTRDWQEIEDMRLSEKDENFSKTMNTHLHIIEPYTNLLRVWNSTRLREATTNLLNIFLDTIEDDTKRGHLNLFFDDDWNCMSNILSYGHDIEASWLLLETAQVLGDKALKEKALAHTERIATAALEGRCFDGSMVYERHANGAYDNDKHWWVQAENVIGQIYLWKYHNRPEMLEKAWQSWQYIRENLVDYDKGEWHWSRRSVDGTINRDDDKAGFWKCPYHNSRMCIEVFERLND